MACTRIAHICTDMPVYYIILSLSLSLLSFYIPSVLYDIMMFALHDDERVRADIFPLKKN